MSSLPKSQIFCNTSHLISGEVRCPKLWDIWGIVLPSEKLDFLE